MADFAELSNEQVRQVVDARQAFGAWRDADREFRHSYRGSMGWKKVNGTEYLYRTYGAVKKSQGPRSPETEKIKSDYQEQRTRLRQRTTRLQSRLKAMAPINRAMRLGRVPEIAAKVLRALDEEGLLGRQLFVVGTHSLYAYEARAGVAFSSGLTATADVDLLWDTRRRLRLAMAEDVLQRGVIGLLQRIDRSFSSENKGYRAVNDDGYFVDLIRPIERNEIFIKAPKLAKSDDMEAATVLGLQWLINAPKFEEMAIGADGRPLMITCIDPRAFALHKYWLSKRHDREADKRRRDAAQAKAVSIIAAKYMNLTFQAKDLSALPLELMAGAKELAKLARKEASTQEKE